MRGSPVYQIMQLWQKSGINQIGTSRHAAKAEARLEIAVHGGKGSSHEIAQRVGIHSYGTADAYRDVWIAILKHTRNLDGTRDVELLSNKHITSFLAQKVADGVKLATYQQYSAAAQKLAVALTGYAKTCGTGQNYSFEQAIKDVNKLATESLEKFSGSRAYSDPLGVIKAIGNPDHQLAARLQLSSGVRISEAALIKENQLLGIKIDPYTGKERGYYSVQGKGGKISVHHSDKGTYRQLCTRLQKAGEFRIDKDEYRQSIKDASMQIGCAYHSSHGFRWNYAATRTRECMAAGNSYEKSLAVNAIELGHNRTSITEHYRK